MEIRQAWFCPACQRHHAPHVETCPGSHAVAPLPYRGPAMPYMPPPVYTVPKWEPSTLPPYDPNMMVIN